MNVATSLMPSVERTQARAERSARQPEFTQAYGAQLAWSQLPIKKRLAKIDNLRSLLVENRVQLSEAIDLPMRQGYRETLTTEILPLADSILWLKQRARRILQPRYSRWRLTPLWLGRISSTVHRVPHGLVLIVGPSNYPLLLTGIPMMQALAAGNGVVLKPAPGAERITQLLVKLAEEAGIPEGLIVLLDSEIAAAKGAIEAGVDKVVLTGSSLTGRKVLHQLADSLTPATLELSGCDAVYVLPGADMGRVCDLLLFGLQLNGGATCMSPRRVFVTRKACEVFHRLLGERMKAHADWSTVISQEMHQRIYAGVQDALAKGAKLFESEPLKKPPQQETSSPIRMGAFVLTDATPDMELCSADIFAPITMIIPVDNWADALQSDSHCSYALSASLYGPLEDALRITRYISAGSITINDTIVPTIDPQLPFGGRGESGYGVTRGDEGLLEMTVPKVVSVRKGNWLPHTQPFTQTEEDLLDGVLQCSHSGSWLGFWKGMRQIVKAIMAKRSGG